MQHRHEFHHSRTSGAFATRNVSQLLRALALIAPLVVSEVVHDPEQARRIQRIVTAASGVLMGVEWQNRVRREREQADDYSLER